MEVHPDFVMPPAKPKRTTQLYRVHRNAPVTPGVMIETALLASSSDLALGYLKVKGPDYVANQVHGISAEGPEGQVIMSRYAPESIDIPHPAGDKEPPAPKPLHIYKLELTKNVRQRSYFLMIVVAASEADARAMLPPGMSRSQASQFGWNDDQEWTCYFVGTAAPEIVEPIVLASRQKW